MQLSHFATVQFRVKTHAFMGISLNTKILKSAYSWCMSMCACPKFRNCWRQNPRTPVETKKLLFDWCTKSVRRGLFKIWICAFWFSVSTGVRGFCHFNNPKFWERRTLIHQVSIVKRVFYVFFAAFLRLNRISIWFRQKWVLSLHWKSVPVTHLFFELDFRW